MARPVHSGLILPGDVERAGGRLQIHVPSGYESEQDALAAGEERLMVCRVVVNYEERLLCGKLFRAGEERAYETHVGQCARRHIDQIQAASPRSRLPIFNEDEWDPEVAAHMKKVGVRMVEEGRLEVKPSERAGF